MKKKLAISVIGALCIALLLVSVASAASKSYYGTTVYYYNGINDFGTSWNANYRASTSPATYMDILGLNVWTAYVSCNGTIQFNPMCNTKCKINLGSTRIMLHPSLTEWPCQR